MNIKDIRCPVCHEVFTPSTHRTRYCARCRPYILKYKRLDLARYAFKADMKAQGKKVSTMPVAKGCDGCVYWRGVDGAMKFCNYYLDTLIRRPCCPGKNCIVRVDKKGAKRGEKQAERPQG